MLKNKRILFILLDYPLGISTMLINAIAMLKENGNNVAIISNSDQLKDLPCESWLSELFVPVLQEKPVEEPVGKENKIKEFIKNNKFLYFFIKVLKKILQIPIRKKITENLTWEEKNSGIFDFAAVLKKYLSDNKPDIVMPVECFSLIATVEALKQIEPKPEIIYYDMELLDWAPENPLYTGKLELKQRQFEALQQVKHVVITSFNRAKIFAKINQFFPENISVLPVVPRKRKKQSSSYFRDKFKIGHDNTLVIYAGNFMPWAQCLEIIESMSSWPKNAVLVMHTWNKGSLSLDYFQRMVEAAKFLPVYFSADYLRYDELGVALSSADIGLFYYQDIDDNFTEICFSSNKMGEYLASGLPLICSPHKSLKEFVDKHKIGFAVNFAEIGNAIKDISADKKRYNENVKTCCEEYFVFDKYFNQAFTPLEKAADPCRR